MCRLLALSAAVLLAQASSALAQPTSIGVQGQLSGNNFVTVSCTVGNNGQITGSGVLYGKNPQTGAITYSYPFAVSRATTTGGKLVLTGKMAAGPAVTISATVPNGPLVFSYVVNGVTYSLTGQGTVVAP